MPSSGIIGFGTLFQYDNSGYTTVAEVVDITAPSLSCDVIDSTSNSSAAGGWREKAICGLADPGEVTITAIYVEGTYNTLMGYIRSNKTWRITFTDSSKFDFTGWITNLEVSAPLDHKLMMNMTITLSAKPTFTVV